MTGLKVDFAGLEFNNPFILAAGPATNPRPGVFKAAAEAGWGGAITRVMLSGGDAHSVDGYLPRMFFPNGQETIKNISDPWYLQNITRIPKNLTKGLPIGCEDVIKAAKEETKGTGMRLGINISTGQSLDEWVELAKVSEKAGADFVEINLSCPYIPGFGLYMCYDSVLAAQIVKAVTESVRIPVWVKISAVLPQGSLGELAKTFRNNGADAITSSNAVLGIVGVDVETNMPISTFVDEKGELRGAITGISGSSIKPQALRSVVEISLATKGPVSGVGGISDWRSAVEFMLLGAGTVQLCSSVMVRGYSLVKELKLKTVEYMQRKGYEEIGEIVGLTSKKYMHEDYVSPAREQSRIVAVDQEKCNGCQKCVRTCQTTNLGAIKVNNYVAEIDQNLCVQCNMCTAVCPEKAIFTKWDVNKLLTAEVFLK